MSAPKLSSTLAAFVAAGPVLSRTDAEFITLEHFAVKRANEIRDWAPAICGLVAHILNKVKKATPTLQDKLLEKARSVSDRRQIEVPLFTYTSTVLKVAPSTEFTTTDSYTSPDGVITYYNYKTTAGDAARMKETTIHNTEDWEGGEVPAALRHIPLRRLLAFDCHAMGLLSILLGDNIKVVKRLGPAKEETEHYKVHDTVLMAKFFTVKEDQTMPLGEKIQLDMAREMWLPPPAPVQEEEAEEGWGGCGYEWCDGSCDTGYD
jgi:hypothetical protein